VIVPRDRVRHVAAAAAWIAILLPLAAVLLSVGLSPATNWTVRGALVGFCILAIGRPDVALLCTIAFVGFGIILSHLAGVPALRVTEVLVVVSLAGCLVRALPPGSHFRRALAGSISVPIALLALAAVASTVVWQRVYQFETGYAASYLQALFQFVSRDYFFQPGDFQLLISTAIILEGLGLYVAVAAICRLDVTFFERALRMLVLGGAGVAMMSVVRLAEIVLRSPGYIEALRVTGAGVRISPQIPDLIAAGSYFGLCWLVALGITMAASGRRVLWVAAGLTLMAALYLTGSRSVIAAALAGLIAFVLILVRQRAAAVRGVVAFAVAAGVVMVLSYQWLIGRDIAGEQAWQSLTVRAELMRTGLQILETRPLFGVGLDRFYLLAWGIASPELRYLWPGRMNPHNDFLRFGAELGLLGLGFFLWILGAAGRRIWLALREARDARLAGLAGGLVAFLVTSMVSNPLMLREVSYVFWIALGLAAGHAARLQASADAQAGPGLTDDERRTTSDGLRASRYRWPIAILLGSLLVVSIPFRARQELAGVDATRVNYGFFEWGTEPDGRLSRWTGPRATFFVDGSARAVEIPLSGTPHSGVRQQVEIRIDGRLANRVAVGPEWQRLRTLLPTESSTSPRRIDLVVSPSWVPAEVFPGSQDRRVLGVKVGEINVIKAAR
jgi:O-antigen ligase